MQSVRHWAGHAGHMPEASRVLALSLIGTVAAGEAYDPDTWARNCASLAKYYGDSEHEFALAEYLLAAGDAAAKQAPEDVQVALVCMQECMCWQHAWLTLHALAIIVAF